MTLPSICLPRALLVIVLTGWLCMAAQAQSTATAPDCRQLVASGNPQYAPYLWRSASNEDRLVGANADLLTWLSMELGVAIESRYVGPWGRVQEEMRAGRIDLIAGAFFTQARTEYMDYFYPAFRETRSVVLVRDNSKLDFKRWADLAPLQGVTVIGNSLGEEFDRFAREHLNISQVATLERALQMLQRSRVDYLVYEDAPAAAYQARLNIDGIKPLLPAVASEPLHLTLSHRSACNTPELRGRIARAMYKLSRQPALMNGWIEKNIQLWKKSGA
ncbi:MAG TPA: transporter substrate-binding domain-containing protein [Roseateles sp.]|uniref:substrate-binding periplasmic protein n=1 Tax=Roseateles sp. TaxID=1971397 RepID=UPI002EDB17CF